MPTIGHRNGFRLVMNCQSKSREIIHSQLCMNQTSITIGRTLATHVYTPSNASMNRSNATEAVTLNERQGKTLCVLTSIPSDFGGRCPVDHFDEKKCNEQRPKGEMKNDKNPRRVYNLSNRVQGAFLYRD